MKEDGGVARWELVMRWMRGYDVMRGQRIGLDSMSWSHDYMVCAYVLMDGWMDGYPGVFSFFFFLALRTRCCGGVLVFLTSFTPQKRSARVYIA